METPISSLARTAPALGVALLALGCGLRLPEPPAPNDPGRPVASARPHPASPSAAPTVPIEPSEEITPEELATIPEPVPPSSAAGASPRRPAETAPRASSDASRAVEGDEQARIISEGQSAPQGPGAARSDRSGASGPGGAPGVVGGWIWRVQVFASERREEAERIAEEAGRRLKASAVVEYEAMLYKVRLGRFADEGEALALRELAIRAGYPGAFRIKTSASASNTK